MVMLDSGRERDQNATTVFFVARCGMGELRILNWDVPCDGFAVCRSYDGVLSCLLPQWSCLFTEAMQGYCEEYFSGVGVRGTVTYGDEQRGGT